MCLCQNVILLSARKDHCGNFGLMGESDGIEMFSMHMVRIRIQERVYRSDLEPLWKRRRRQNQSLAVFCMITWSS